MCREAVRDCHLRGIADVQRLSRKLSAKKVTLQELCQLYMASNQLPALVDVLDSHEGVARSGRLSTATRPSLCDLNAPAPDASERHVYIS